LAARIGLHTHLQPQGEGRDGRHLPRQGLAVGEAWSERDQRQNGYESLVKQAIQERATELSGEGQWQKAARPLEPLISAGNFPSS
jgi:hypothetical protein